VTINAQTIGAVLTGAGAKARVTQNIENVERMRQLVFAMRDALNQDPGLDTQKKSELLEIADETRVELEKSTPNETKLMTLFALLTQSVQTLPAAIPAYEAAKALLTGWGMNP